MRKRKYKAGLWQRVGSCFENGYGDEGWDAKLIYGLLMCVLIVLSAIAGLIMAIATLFKWLKKALFGRKDSVSS